LIYCEENFIYCVKTS